VSGARGLHRILYETIPEFRGFLKEQTTDTLMEVWRCFRLGTTLCILYKRLLLGELALLDDPANHQDATAKFLSYLQHTLGFREDEIFSMADLYSNKIEGFQKVHTYEPDGNRSKTLKQCEIGITLDGIPCASQNSLDEVSLHSAKWLILEAG
jgi:hypothetical protein